MLTSMARSLSDEFSIDLMAVIREWFPAATWSNRDEWRHLTADAEAVVRARWGSERWAAYRDEISQDRRRSARARANGRTAGKRPRDRAWRKMKKAGQAPF